MAEDYVSVRIVTKISKSYGAITLDVNQTYEGTGQPLVDEVDAALTAIVALIRDMTTRSTASGEDGPGGDSDG